MRCGKNFFKFSRCQSKVRPHSVYHWILLLLILSLAPGQAMPSGAAITADSITRFIHFSTQQGLASDKVLNILQDRYGFIWLATDFGLSRYDGTAFRNYFHTETDTCSLSDNTVTALCEDAEGTLWVGTRNGLNRYDRETATFRRYTTRNGLKNNFIKALHADKEGHVWIETDQGYLTQFNRPKAQWNTYPHPAGIAEGNYYYWHIYEDRNQNLWIGGRTLQGIVFSKKTHQAVTRPTWSDKGIALESAFFTETPDGSLFSSSAGSIQRYDPHQEKFVHYHSIPFEATCGVTDRQGNIWIGGYGGLVRWSYPEDSFTLFTNSSNRLSGLSSNHILCLHATQDGCVWIGTDKGAYLYSPHQNLFRFYPGYDVSALMEDRDRNLWVGTENDGSYVFNWEKGSVSHFNYRLMTKDIDPSTFHREKETLRQYIRHEAIYSNPPLPEEIVEDYAAYRKADLHFRYQEENRVTALYQDRNGMIYVGLWNHVGFNVYDPRHHTWKRYALWSKKPDYHYPRLWLGNPFGANWYNGFLEDRKGRLWCATWEAFGLNLFNREKGRFDFKHYFPNNVPSFPHGKIEQIFYDPVRKQYLMNGRLNFLGAYDCREKRFYQFGEQFPADYPNRDLVEGYYQYSKTSVFSLPYEFDCQSIQTDGKDKLFLASPQQIIYMDLTDHRTYPVCDLSGGSAFAWTLSDDGSVLLVHSGKGFFTIDTNTLKQQKASVPEINCTDKGIAGDAGIRKLLYRNHRELWAATDKMLWRLAPQGEWVPMLPDPQEVSSLAKDPEGRLYAGTSKGLYIFGGDRILGHYPFSETDHDGIPGNQIRNIYPTGNYTCWIATNQGLVQLKTGQKQVYGQQPDKPYGLLSNDITVIAPGPDQQLWVGTDRGLCLFNPKSQRFTDMSRPGNDCLTSRLASCLAADSRGDIWIGTSENGLNRLSLEADTLTHFYHEAWNPFSLPDNEITSICCGSHGEVWVGTPRGAARYLRKLAQFRPYGTTAQYQIRGIQDDRQSQLWMSTHNGLLLVDSCGTIIRKFYDYHGLPHNNLSRAICRLQDGSIAVGCDYGFCLFQPEALKKDFPAPQLLLSSMKVNGERYPADINGTRKLALKAKENSFAVHFSGAAYEFSPYLKYRYRLLPLDKGWNYTQPPYLAAQYTRLPAGNYRLEIEVSNAFGEWNGHPLTLALHIATPWYRSWWFISLSTSAILLGIWGIIRFRERQLRKRNEDLEKQVEERTEKLYLMMENKNKFFNIVSHDLKSPLSHLNLLSEGLLEEFGQLDEEEKIRKIQLIHQVSSQGKALLDNLQLWVLSQKDIIRPAFRPTRLNDEIAAVLQLLDPHIRQKALTVSVPGQPVEVYTDKNMLSTILRNLISNAIKYSYPGGSIHIRVQETPRCWKVSVEDHGTGMPPERVDKLFQTGTKVSCRGTAQESGTGLGLLIVKEFINRLGETIQVKSIEGKGSIFTFTLQKTLQYDQSIHC